MPSVKFYQNGDFHPLSGAKIYQNGAWIKILSHSKIWLNGAWHDIGGSAENPVTIPTPPTIPNVPAQSLTHENSTEPSTGTIRYITPDGAGNLDGSSWANAASGSMIHVILLSCASGDSVYFAEGDYTIDRTITLPAGVNLYGGFDTDKPVWRTRNGFINQTIFTGDNTFGWMDGSAATSGQIVDGFVVQNFNSTITGSKAMLRNSIVSGGTAIIPIGYNCVFDSANVRAVAMTYCNVFYGRTSSISGNADHVNVYGTENAKVSFSIGGTANYCTVINCTSSYTCIFGSGAANCIAVNCASNYSYIFGPSATNCTAVNCTSSIDTPPTDYRNTGIFRENSKNCTAVNCTSSINICNRSDSSTCIFGNGAANCTAVNCTSNLSFSSTQYSYIYIFGSGAANCTAVNCTSNSPDNSLYIFGEKSKSCTAVNCASNGESNFAYIFLRGAANCIAVNCAIDSKSSTYIFGIDAASCTAVNCTSNSRYSSGYIFVDNKNNCISWNNSGTEFIDYSTATTCAGSTYNAALALTLGTDNSIARFTNTGYYPAHGVQDVGDCPSPIDDPAGYAAYLAAFGDWHPAANSFLIGKGTADSSVTTDADGVTRPDPPTIGAYEPVPASA